MYYKEYFNRYMSSFEFTMDNQYDYERNVELLTEEGYELNIYAKEFLMSFGGIIIKGTGKRSKNTVQIQFDPIVFASGEYDRMDVYNQVTKDVLFPVGGLYDYTLFIGKKGQYYIADWKNLYLCGKTMDEFFESIFNDDVELIELYSNDDL